jgi:RNA polymerase sigma-70 factor (ECF subfamily)
MAESERRERAEKIRREVSYLAESYRVIIAKHYFHGQSIRDIAAELVLSEGTVKSRMDFGRKQMRKGIEQMEHYTENSYLPKKMFICNSGECGLNMEPMSLVPDDDPLTQNLLLLAYEKPVFVSELARAIGVAAAYIEPIIRRLVDGQLMVRMGDGKIYTDFVIYSADDTVRNMREQEEFAAKHADIYCEALADAIAELKQTDFYSLRLERYMMIKIASVALWKTMERHRAPQTFPDRPNGGKWIAFGMIDQKHRDPMLYTGRDNYNLSGERCEQLDNYLGTERLALLNYESSLYPYPKLVIDGFTTFMEAEAAALKLFYLIEKGLIPFRSMPTRAYCVPSHNWSRRDL